MTTKRLSAAEQSVDRHYALHMSNENDAGWICPACGPSEKTMNAMEFWKSSMRWSDKMNEKEACEFAEAYNAALRSQLEEASIPEGKIDAVFVGPIVRKIYGDSAELGHYKLAIEAFKQGREGTLVVLGQLGMAKLRAEEAQRENEEVRLGIGTLQRLKVQAERDFATAQARIVELESENNALKGTAGDCWTRIARLQQVLEYVTEVESLIEAQCSARSALAEPQSGEK